MLRKVRFHTGPTIVNEVVARAEKAGYTILGGTEHVYVNLVDNEDGWGVLGSIDKFQEDIGVKLGFGQVYGTSLVAV